MAAKTSNSSKSRAKAPQRVDTSVPATRGLSPVERANKLDAVLRAKSWTKGANTTSLERRRRAVYRASDSVIAKATAQSGKAQSINRHIAVAEALVAKAKGELAMAQKGATAARTGMGMATAGLSAFSKTASKLADRFSGVTEAEAGLSKAERRLSAWKSALNKETERIATTPSQAAGKAKAVKPSRATGVRPAAVEAAKAQIVGAGNGPAKPVAAPAAQKAAPAKPGLVSAALDWIAGSDIKSRQPKLADNLRNAVGKVLKGGKLGTLVAAAGATAAVVSTLRGGAVQAAQPTSGNVKAAPAWTPGQMASENRATSAEVDRTGVGPLDVALGALHPKAEQHYAAADAALYKARVARGVQSQPWPQKAAPDGKAYLNDGAKAKAEAAKPAVAAPAAGTRAAAQQPTSDGETAGYNRVDSRTGMVVQVQSYKTPKK